VASVPEKSLFLPDVKLSYPPRALVNEPAVDKPTPTPDVSFS
jgi:hypothetical protein